MSSDVKETLLSGEDYLWAFDEQIYTNFWYPVVEGDLVMPSTTFSTKCFHKTFSQGDIQGERLLDFSTGPSIISSISACKWFKSVTLSDYCPQSRDLLSKWVKKAEDAYDFSPYFKFICKLEGNEDEWQNREEHFRSSVEGILESDWTKDDILNPAPIQPYDCVITSYTLECALFDKASVERALLKVNRIINTGGFLIVCGLFNSTEYSVGSKVFRYLGFNQAFIDEALQRCGFQVVKWSLNEKVDYENEEVDCDEYYFVVARKIKSN